ncbi:MAG TPA: pitrilysin family protein [Patescibacteria group bacterium]|nr:pitrilysin family protein [Patescibacteria group bacterium]
MQKQDYTKHVLKNGLTVLLIPMTGVSSATVLAYVNTGSRYEPAQWGGISHFLEHMVFKGTAKYPTPKALAEAVDAVGAEFNAFTSKEYTGYYVKSASKHIPLALDVISDMLLTPRLLEEDLQREKGVIVEEMNMYADTPARHIGDVFEQLMFAKSSLGRDIIGTKKTVSAMNRDHFVSYLKQWYGPGNMVVTIAGDATALSRPSLLKTVEEAFSKTSADTANRENGGKRVIGNVLSQGGKLQIEYKKTEQAHFIMAVPGLLRKDPNKFTLGALSVLFGGNMSSRLFTEVREKRGLCYYVRSDVDSFHDAGVFGAAAGVDPNRVDEAVKVVHEEFYALASGGSKAITDAEVTRAKDYLTGKTVLDFEDSESVANYYGSKQLLEGKVTTRQEALEKIAAVQPDAVRALAKKLLSDTPMYFAMIGPFKDKERFQKLLVE